MTFNLSRPWTAYDVSELLASVEDDRNWRIIVDRAGNVSLIDNETEARIDLDQLHGYFETYAHGSGYVGQEAADAPHWVKQVEGLLRSNWPHLEHGAYIDH